MKKLTLFCFLFFQVISQNVFAQSSDQEFRKMLEDMQKRHREFLNSFFSDDADMGSLFDQMDKNFSDDFGLFFKDINNPVVGSYDWVEDANFKILKIKITPVKDKPLDIKVENHQIKIKGLVENQNENKKVKEKTIVTFERVFSLPEDIDETNPKFENTNGEYLIKFPKLKGAKPPVPNFETVPKGGERTPVAPDSKDLSI